MRHDLNAARASSPLETALQRRARRGAPVVYLRPQDEAPLIPRWLSRTLTVLTWMAFGVVALAALQGAGVLP